MIGVGETRVNTLVAAAALPLSLGLLWLLVAKYGVWGAAYAQLIVATGYALLQLAWSWRVLARLSSGAAKLAQVSAL